MLPNLVLGSAAPAATQPSLLPLTEAQSGASTTAAAGTVMPSRASQLRSPSRLIGNQVNAQSLGLICDGKSDNAQAFDAIRAKAARTGGETVFFPPSALPCLSSRPLIAVSRTIYSAIPDTVALRPTSDSTAGPLLFLASGVTDVQVQGLSFDGALGTLGNTNTAVVVYKSARVVFDQVTVRDTLGIGILFSTGVSNSGVRVSSVVNVGNRWRSTGLRRDQHQGIAFCCGQANDKNFVIGNLFADVGLDAISFTDQTDFRAVGNRSTNAGGEVAGVLGAELDAGVTNRSLIGGAAIYGAASRRVTVVSNMTDGAGGNGIDLYKVDFAEIIANTARRSGGNGIAFAAASNAAIIGNVSLGNNQARSSAVSAPQAGIFLTGGLRGDPLVRDVTISGNIVTDDQAIKTQNYGIQLQDGSVSSDICVDASNRLFGNAVAAFGEGIADCGNLGHCHFSQSWHENLYSRCQR